MTNELKEIALEIDSELYAEGFVATGAEYAIEFATRLLAALPKPEPVAKIVRNSAGQIRTFDMDGDAFDISQYVGVLLYTAPVDQSARIAELEAEVAIEQANGKHWADAYSKWVESDVSAKRLIDQSQRIAELERQNAELRKDAERYRFIREASEWMCGTREAFGECGELSHDRLDEAIDAALAEWSSSHDPELEAKIRAEFEQAMEDWLAHDDWQFADREAAWKFFFLAGRASVLDGMEQVACPTCHGNGTVWKTVRHGESDYEDFEVDCSLCDASGYIYRLPPQLQEEKEKM